MKNIMMMIVIFCFLSNLGLLVMASFMYKDTSSAIYFGIMFLFSYLYTNELIKEWK